MGAIEIFCLVFATALPAVLPLLVIGDPWLALRLSNLLVVGLLFPGKRLELRLIAALTAFSLFEASYYAEIIRAGILSVTKGQFNAGLALWMSRRQVMRLVVLPQALRRMIPLLLTQAIVLFQDSTLVYVINLDDFFRKAYNIGNTVGTLNELILFAGAVYLVICTLASGCVRQLHRKLTVLPVK